MWRLSDIGVIQKQIKWIKKQLDCIKKNGLSYYVFEGGPDVVYDDQTSILTVTFLNGEEKTTPISIQGTSDLIEEIDGGYAQTVYLQEQNINGETA